MICSYTLLSKQIPASTTGSRLFLIGCTSYKLDSITKHENSLQHKHAVKVNEGKSKPVEESEARKIISTLNKENLEKLEKCFVHVMLSLKTIDHLVILYGYVI